MAVFFVLVPMLLFEVYQSRSNVHLQLQTNSQKNGIHLYYVNAKSSDTQNEIVESKEPFKDNFVAERKLTQRRQLTSEGICTRFTHMYTHVATHI